MTSVVGATVSHADPGHHGAQAGPDHRSRHGAGVAPVRAGVERIVAPL